MPHRLLTPSVYFLLSMFFLTYSMTDSGEVTPRTNGSPYFSEDVAEGLSDLHTCLTSSMGSAELTALPSAVPSLSLDKNLWE